MNRLIVPFLLALSASASAVLTPGWTKSPSGAISTGDYARDVAFDSAGNVYLAGSTTDNATDRGDATVFKYSPGGSLIFKAVIPDFSDGDDEAMRVFPTPTGCVVVGVQRNTAQTSGRVFIRALNSSGATLWSDLQTLGQLEHVVDAVATSTNYVVVTSRTNALGNSFAHLAAWSQAGARQWTNSWARSPFESSIPRAVAGNGSRVAVAVSVFGSTGLAAVASFTSEGEETFSHFSTWIEARPESIAMDPTGRITMFSSTEQSNGSDSVLVQRYSSSGLQTFSTIYADLAYSSPATSVQDSSAPVNGQAYGFMRTSGTAGTSPAIVRWIGSYPVFVVRTGPLSQRSIPIAMEATDSRIVALDGYRPDAGTPELARVSIYSTGGTLLDRIVTQESGAVFGQAVAYGPNRSVAVASHRFTPNRTLFLQVFQNKIGIQSIVSDKSSVKGLKPVKFTITLTEPAGSGGQPVQLTSTTGSINVPVQSVLVAAGQITKTVEVTTDAVHANTNGIVTATSDGVAKTVAVRVDAPLLEELKFNPPYPHEDVHVGEEGVVFAKLDSAAPAGFTVALSAPAALGLPSTFTFGAGDFSEGETIQFPRANADQLYNLSASKNGVTKTLAITAKRAKIVGLTLDKTWVEGGVSFVASVTTRGRSLNAYNVVLTDDSPNITSPLISVAAGALAASKTVGTTQASTTGTFNVTATAGGASRTKTMRVLRPILKSIIIPSPAAKGTNVECVLVLNDGVPGMIVDFTKTGLASVTSYVTFEGSEKTKSFYIRSETLATGTITAKIRAGGKSLTKAYAIQ